MPARLYPKIEHKICQGCKKKFKRKYYDYGLMWINRKYCSYKCFGKVDGAYRKELYKDETKHPKWKGDNVGYYGIHDWMTKHYGQPKGCEICGLKDRKRVYHWANLTGEYLRDRKDWKRMCVPCHRKYDYANPRQNKKIR